MCVCRRAARTLQRILQTHKLINVPMVIVNRPGGNGTLALNQLRASTGDGHVLLIMNSITLSAHIAGLTPYGHADFTPLAIMFDEDLAFVTRGESRIRTGAELVAGDHDFKSVEKEIKINWLK